MVVLLWYFIGTASYIVRTWLASGRLDSEEQRTIDEEQRTKDKGSTCKLPENRQTIHIIIVFMR